MAGTTHLDMAPLLAEAEQLAGFADSEQAAFGGNLAALVDAINREARLNETGHAIARDMITGLLTHRISGLKWVEQHPEILAERIDQPVFLTGLPRSGTT